MNIDFHGNQTINLPPTDTFIEFKSYHKKLIAPFVIYADVGYIIIPCEVQRKEKTKSYSYETQKHKICRYGYKVVCKYDDKYTKRVKICKGENASFKFYWDNS